MEMPKFYAPKPCEVPKGAVGVWQIPDLDIMIPVYNSNYKNIQKILDDENSAAMSRWCSAYDIGDHCGSISSNGKGKWRMDNIKPGMVAFFVKPNETTMHSCVMTAIADAKSWGYLVNGQMLTPHSSKDILNSCCVGSDSTRNYVSVFKLVGKV